jgi:hypothetical protein
MLRSCFVSAAVTLLVACESNNGDPSSPIPGSGNVQASALDYPSQGIGTSLGDVIPNFCFPGFVNPNESKTETEICLGHFYNPSGEGSYGPDDPFVDGEPLPTVMVIDVSARWCGPCKQEAQTELPGIWDELHPLGLMLVTVLSDGEAQMTPATLDDLTLWTTAYKNGFPSVIDPTYQMGALFAASQYPAHFTVDLKTMVIRDFYAGKPPESYWQKVEAEL